MKRVMIARDSIVISPEMGRSKGSKNFEERLKSSIEQVGLAEPIKVAVLPDEKYLVVDGMLRLKAIAEIQRTNPSAFALIPAYVVDYQQRFEIRFQTDIYQDLLPSQLAVLVEHLHNEEGVRKVDVARYIGVSPPTVRNYTGLSRMLQRGGLFEKLVELMDVGVIPASNPYAWLRLNTRGLRFVIESRFSDSESAEKWIDDRIKRARQGFISRFPNIFVEDATRGLPPECYREAQDVRNQKRDLGKRRALTQEVSPTSNNTEALEHLSRVSRRSREPVLRIAARSLQGYLQ
jgi:hypothetical protein